MHSFSTLYILGTHATKTHPEILLFCWFLASQEKVKIKIKTIKTTLFKIASRKQRDSLQGMTLAPYLGRGSPSQHSWLVLLLAAGSGRNLDEHRGLYKFDF